MALFEREREREREREKERGGEKKQYAYSTFRITNQQQDREKQTSI